MLPRPGGAPHSGASPLPSSALEAFSAAELAVSGAGVALLLAGGVFVAGVATAARSAPVLVPFTALWAPRLGLHAAAMLALGAMLLRLPGWWSAGGASWTGAEATPLDAQRLACRLSVAVAYGAALPLLGALAAGLSAAPLAAPLLPLGRSERGRPGTRVLLLATAVAAPFAAAQALIAFHDPIFGPRGGLRRSFAPRWLDVFQQVDSPPSVCADAGEGAAACALCLQPLLASAVSALAALLFGGAQLVASRRLARAALSARLAARARAAGSLLLIAPLLSAGARGVSTLFRPRTLWFELLMAADFGAVLLMAAAATLPLAVLPSVAAARAGAAIGWGDPAAAVARDVAARGGALLEPLLPAAAAAEVGDGAVPVTPAGVVVPLASAAPLSGLSRSSAVLGAAGGTSTRRALLAVATPSTGGSQRSTGGSWHGGEAGLAGAPYSAGGGSASGGSRYGTPYSG